MAIIEPATKQMLKNIIDGTTPPERAIADEDGKNFKDYYALKSELSSTVIETTITDLNSLPRETGIYKNETGFTTNVPIGSANPPYIVNQEVYTALYASVGIVVVVQKCASSNGTLYQRIAYCFGGTEPLLNGTFMWLDWKIIADSLGKVYATQAETATKVGTANKGSATKPIYLSAGTPTEINYTLGAACEKSVSDSTSDSALSSTDTNVPTVRDIYYGMPTINGTKASNGSIYAPNNGGTHGSIPVASGGTATPYWSFPFFALGTVNNIPSTTETTWKKMYIKFSSTQSLLFQWRRVNSSGSSAKHDAITFSSSYAAVPTVLTTYAEIGNTSSVSNMYGWLSAISSSGCTVRSYGGMAFWVLAIGLVNA